MGTKADRLEELRQDLGLSKSEMASIIGVDRTYYQHIVAQKGKGNLRVEHIIKLITQLGINPTWLLTGEGDKIVRNNHHINWQEEPTEQQIEELFLIATKDRVLNTIQSLKMKLACAHCYIAFKDAKTIEELSFAARVYLDIILNNPDVDIGQLIKM